MTKDEQQILVELCYLFSEYIRDFEEDIRILEKILKRSRSI